jgi:hypothetical protein
VVDRITLLQKNVFRGFEQNQGGLLGDIMPSANTTVEKRKEKLSKAMSCQRCGGRMIFEKFYDVNNIFFGWHCVMCGEILDPVILLHRLSQDADLQIPEGEEQVMQLLKKYFQSGALPARKAADIKV